MKSSLIVIAILVAISVFAVSVGRATADSAAANTTPEKRHAAQAGNPTGRFQITSFAAPKSGTGVGYYVIDSTTGEIWMNYGDNKPSKVSGPLLR